MAARAHKAIPGKRVPLGQPALAAQVHKVLLVPLGVQPDHKADWDRPVQQELLVHKAYKAIWDQQAPRAQMVHKDRRAAQGLPAQ